MKKLLVSCWDRFKLKFLWRGRSCSSTRKKRVGCKSCDVTEALSTRRRKSSISFKYDPLSYAQNFDDGYSVDENLDSASRALSSRFPAPFPARVVFKLKSLLHFSAQSCMSLFLLATISKNYLFSQKKMLRWL